MPKPLSRSKQVKLNLGCGNTRLHGYVNIDCEKKCHPDVVHDFTKKALPYVDGSVDEIVFFHTIEHISMRLHELLLNEFARVLKIGGKVYISYPNFWECAKRWKDNVDGKREYWQATIFGRQLYPSDFHVCAMDPSELAQKMVRVGFQDIKHAAEKQDLYYTLTIGTKAKVLEYIGYEELLRTDIGRMHLVK